MKSNESFQSNENISIPSSGKDLNYIEFQSIEEKVYSLIIRDLTRLNWSIKAKRNSIVITPPSHYDKDTIKNSMSFKRNEIIKKNTEWIKKHTKLAQMNLANGIDVLNSRIEPTIEVCQTQKQHDLFRYFRYYWSSPYSEYVGRRIKLLVRDESLPNKPVIGIAALGSPIIHIPERDDWIGWDKHIRTQNIIYTMDAYVLGALPPYNYLLGGKLVSYILASKEVREIYEKKYENMITNIRKRTACDLVCIFTTSLYGKGSQYNRIKYNDKALYIPIGETKGYGTLHLSEETFNTMLELLKSKGIFVTNHFGDGPSWRMRVIRTVGDILGFDSSILLKHSFKRSIYAVPLADNFKNFLKDDNVRPNYYNYSMNDLVTFWKDRWFEKRLSYLKDSGLVSELMNFKPEGFTIR